MENEAEATKSEKNRRYEIGFLLIDETGLADFRSALEKRGAEIITTGSVKSIPLAYKIKKHMQAYFGFVQFSLDPAMLADLERDIKNIPSVLRFLAVLLPRAAKSGDMPEGKREPYRRTTVQSALPISNEALEKKIEEILQ